MKLTSNVNGKQTKIPSAVTGNQWRRTETARQQSREPSTGQRKGGQSLQQRYAEPGRALGGEGSTAGSEGTWKEKREGRILSQSSLPPFTIAAMLPGMASKARATWPNQK